LRSLLEEFPEFAKGLYAPIDQHDQADGENAPRDPIDLHLITREVLGALVASVFQAKAYHVS
jgi:hypothetical protein